MEYIYLNKEGQRVICRVEDNNSCYRITITTVDNEKEKVEIGFSLITK